MVTLYEPLDEVERAYGRRRGPVQGRGEEALRERG